MKRADEAPEPSMEELLASIRLIISDAGKGESRQREAMRAVVPASEAAPPREAAGGPAGDDVFDLTEELVFPGRQAAQASDLPATGWQGEEAQPGKDGPEARRPRGEAAARGAPASPGLPAPAAQNSPGASRLPWPESRRHAASALSRPVWSRRELDPAPYHPAPGRIRQDAIPARPRNWLEDIQMPVPKEGPVSLIPQAAPKAPLLAPGKEEDGGARDEPASRETGAGSGEFEGKEQAANVAALAKRLARSALGAMEESELKDAQQADFERMHRKSRAAVTEKLADAIEQHAASGETSPLPTLLDEVFRQDFLRDKEPDAAQAESEGDFAAFEEAAEAWPAFETQPRAGPEAQDEASAEAALSPAESASAAPSPTEISPAPAFATQPRAEPEAQDEVSAEAALSPHETSSDAPSPTEISLAPALATQPRAGPEAQDEASAEAALSPHETSSATPSPTEISPAPAFATQPRAEPEAQDEASAEGALSPHETSSAAPSPTEISPAPALVAAPSLAEISPAPATAPSPAGPSSSPGEQLPAGVKAETQMEAAAPPPPAAQAARPFQAPAQAQFLGPVQPAVPAKAGGALEEAVREMLRPLLVQWLNENMPRILENAIREEIATRGLLPKSEA